MTRQRFAIVVLAAMFLIMLAGIALMFFAGSIGMRVSGGFIHPNAFMSEYDQFNMVAGSTTTSCQTGGRTLTFIGGAGIICSGIAVYFTLPGQKAGPTHRSRPQPDDPEQAWLEEE